MDEELDMESNKSSIFLKEKHLLNNNVKSKNKSTFMEQHVPNISTIEALDEERASLLIHKSNDDNNDKKENGNKHPPMKKINYQSISDNKNQEKDELEISNSKNGKEKKKKTRESNGSSPSWWEIFVKIKPFLQPVDTKNKICTFLAILCIIMSKMINILPPLAIKKALDAISYNINSQVSSQRFVVISIIKSILYYFSAKLSTMAVVLIQDLLQRSVSLDSERRFANECYSHLQHLSLSYHLEHSVGETSRIMGRGTEAVYMLIDAIIFSLFPTLFELVVVSTVFWKLGTPAVAISTIIAVFIYFVFTLFVRKTRVKYRRRLNTASDEIGQKSTETLVNFELVKMFGRTDYEIAQYAALRSTYKDRRVDMLGMFSSLEFGQKFIRLCGVTSGLVIAGYKTVYGDPPISPGSFIAIQIYIDQLFQPLAMLGYTYRVLTQGMTDLEKTVIMLNSKPEIQDKPNAIIWNPNPTCGIVFHNITFFYKAQTERRALGATLNKGKSKTNVKYEDNDAPDKLVTKDGGVGGIHNISFCIPAGKSAALVGPSGSGKTTVIRLALRMYDPDQGNISIDNNDISSVTQKSLRTNIGVVAQETVLFNTTLRNNILYGKLDATEDELWDAVKASALFDYVQRLPNGLDTLVGERGMKLSGGERQRVGLARCIIKQPQLILLDEATSALDSSTERIVQRNIKELCRGRATLMIAHRLSTARHANEILVMNMGHICERGSHDELLKSNGRYAKMWRDQTLDDEEDDNPM